MADKVNATYKDFYLQYLSEDIASTILETQSEWWELSCPMHNDGFDVDGKRSAGISKTTGVLHCFSEDESWSPAEFLHASKNLSFEDADQIVDLFRSEHNLCTQQKDSDFTRTIPGHNPAFEALFLKSQELMLPEHKAVQEYMRSRKLTYETLLDLDIGYLPKEVNGWGRDALVFPYMHSGKVVGMRFRDVGGNKGYAKGSYWTLWGIDRINDDTRIVILCEGESDAIAAYQSVKEEFGDSFTVVSTPTATFRKEWAREFQGTSQVLLIPQDDAPSEKMCGEAKQYIDNLTVLKLPWGRKQFGKDIPDWFRYHSTEDFQNLVRGSISTRVRHVMTGDQFLFESSKPREWLINGLLSCGQIGMIEGLPKSRKCLGHGSIIELADGQNVKVESLIGKQFYVPSFDFKTLTYGVSKAYAEDNGIHDIVRVTTETGKVIDRTNNHLLISLKNVVMRDDCGPIHPRLDKCSGYAWKRCDELKPKDYILTRTRSPIEATGTYDKDKLKVLAYLIGDGGMSTAGVILSTKNKMMLEDASKSVNNLGDNIRKRAGSSCDYGISGGSILGMLKECGLRGKKSAQKFVPDFVFGLNNEHIALFLNRLYSTDGCFQHTSKHKAHMTAIMYDSISEELCRGIKRLLYRLGIKSTLRSRIATLMRENLPDYKVRSWTLYIADSKNCLLFAETVGCYVHHETLLKIVENAKIKHGGSMRIERNDIPADHYWERVKSIEYIRNMPTVAISVPGVNTYCTPDALEHNTILTMQLVRCLLTGEPFCGIEQFSVPIDKERPKRILFWEEEGPLDELGDRFKIMFEGVKDWTKQVFVAHQLGLKLDSDSWAIKLMHEIESKQIDLLVLDPFSRTYNVDENDSGELGLVWNHIAQLTNKFPKLSIIILHHFTKSGSLSELMTSGRGSIRSHAEADLIIGIEKCTIDGKTGAKVKIEGRSVPTVSGQNGEDILKLIWGDDWLFRPSEDKGLPSGRPGGFLQELRERGEWEFMDAVDHFKVTPQTMADWVSKCVHKITGEQLVERTRACSGKPAMLRYVGPEMKEDE